MPVTGNLNSEGTCLANVNPTATPTSTTAVTSTTETPTTTTQTPTETQTATSTETPATEGPSTEEPTTETHTTTTAKADTSTLKPVTSTPTLTSETSETTTTVATDISTLTYISTTTDTLVETTPVDSKNGGNSWNLTHVLIVVIGTVACLGLCCSLCVFSAICYLKQRSKAPVVEMPKVTSVSVDDATEMAKRGVAEDKPITGEPEPGECEDSEERLKDALHKVAKMKRDFGDLQFGRVLASMRVANEIVADDVLDEMDGVQPTRGEGVAQTRGLRLSEALVAAQPEGGGEAIIDEHF